jgi:two-component system CitB family sensor kinase
MDLPTPPAVLSEDALIAADRWTLWRTVARGLAHSLANASQMLALENPSALARDEARERTNRAVQALGVYGRPAAHPAPTLLPDVLADLEALQSLQSGFPATVLTTAIDDSLPALAIGATELLHVLLALVTNAKEAAGESRAAIRITAQTHEGTAVLRVADGGPGLPLEMRAQAFVAGACARAGHLGLGLPVAALLLARAGGTLTLGAPASGAEVVLHLPVWTRARA